MKRRHALAALLGGVAAPAFAQGWPTKPLRLIVSFAPGGPADIVGRLVGQALQEKLGQQVVVENRAGAGGNIAARFVAGQPADGYTLLVTTSSLAVNQTLYKEPGYDAQRDFVAVANLAASPNILVAPPSDPAADLRQFLQQRRGKPISYGSAGVGSTPHLTADHVLRVLGKLDAVHVPFQGAAPALNAAMANQVTVASVALPPAVPLVKGGKVKALAVTSAKRLAQLPDVPTVAESGFPDVEDTTWVGLFAPRGLPAEVAARLNGLCNEALRGAELRDKLAVAGLEATPGTSAEFAAHLQREIQKWARIVKETGVSPQ